MKEDKFCLNKSVAFLGVVVLFILGVVFVSTQLNKQNLAGNSKAAPSCEVGKVKWADACVKETGRVVRESGNCEVEFTNNSSDCCNVNGLPSWLATECAKAKGLEKVTTDIASHTEGVFWEEGRCFKYAKSNLGVVGRYDEANVSCCGAASAPKDFRESYLCQTNYPQYYNSHAMGYFWEESSCLAYWKDNNGNIQRYLASGKQCCSLSGAPTWYKQSDTCTTLSSQEQIDAVKNHELGYAWDGGCVNYVGTPGNAYRETVADGRKCCCGANNKPVPGTPASMCANLNLASWCAQ